MKRNTILIILMLFLLLPQKAFADCQSDFEAISDGYTISYKYEYETDDFTITMTNPNYEKFMWRFATWEELTQNTPEIDKDKKTMLHVIKNYTKNEYRYEVLGAAGECQGVLVKEGILTLKKENRFAYSDLCKGYEDFVLCQKDYEKEIDEETFKSRLEAYKKDLENKKEEPQQDEKEKIKEKYTSIFDEVLDYIYENLFQVIVIAIFAIAAIVCIIIFTKRYIKSRRLE